MGAYGEMIFTGDELLRGDALNTNQAFLGEKLLDLGVFANRALCITDDLQAIAGAIKESLEREPLVLILSGGLGPTDDDLTREAVAEGLDLPLEFHPELLEEIRHRFVSRGYVMGDSNRKQALLPHGATVIPISGTAPGFILHHGRTLVAALPGVPWELQEMWDATVEPSLRKHVDSLGVGGHVVRRIRTFGIGESAVADLLKEFDWRGSLVEIGTRAKLDGLWVILRATNSPESSAALESTQSRIVELLGERVLGVDCEGLPEMVGSLLRGAGLTLSVAESCTGGLLGKRVTEVPGSSDYFVGGVISYDNMAKTRILGVRDDLIAQQGAVSADVAEAMARGVASLLATDCALSVTGVAGPGGGTEEKPVGLVYIGCAIRGVVEVERLRLFGRREQIRERASLSALDLLRRKLARYRLEQGIVLGQ
ncbi:MAG: competence/damage-inducible protein A [Actinobacteria bacterium]|nr:competence/damage-inducible protein A [Actinomycetota bacterium]